MDQTRINVCHEKPVEKSTAFRLWRILQIGKETIMMVSIRINTIQVRFGHGSAIWSSTSHCIYKCSIWVVHFYCKTTMCYALYVLPMYTFGPYVQKWRDSYVQIKWNGIVYMGQGKSFIVLLWSLLMILNEPIMQLAAIASEPNSIYRSRFGEHSFVTSFVIARTALIDCADSPAAIAKTTLFGSIGLVCPANGKADYCGSWSCWFVANIYSTVDPAVTVLHNSIPFLMHVTVS